VETVSARGARMKEYTTVNMGGGILKMKKIRLWIAVIITITIVGALFLISSSKIHDQSRAYMMGQYRIKDMKLADRPMYSEGGFNDFVGLDLNSSDPHAPKLIHSKHVKKSKHDGKDSDDDFLVFEATVDILDNKMHYREASNGWVPKLNILLFHGERYTSSIWNDIGTLEDLASSGYRVVALELPGTGLSSLNPKLRSAEFIKLFVQHLDLYKPGLVIVSADASNTAALEYVIRYSQNSPLMKGYINIDSADKQYSELEKELAKSIKAHALFLCGAKDVECVRCATEWERYIHSARVHSFSNAYKEFYNEDPVVFNTVLKRFIEYLERSTES